jgi:hypothetical protein
LKPSPTQINYILKFIKPIVRGLVSTFEVTTGATDAYNEFIHARLARSVFIGCLSWYRSGGDGKVSSIFPGTMMLYAWWMRRPRWSDYRIKATNQWERELRYERWLNRFNPIYYLAILLNFVAPSWTSS